MSIIIKRMETEEEIGGKAYVHWQSWHEAYPDIVSREYLEKMTLEKCEQMAFTWPRNTFIALDDGRVVGFVCWGSAGGGVPGNRGNHRHLYPGGILWDRTGAPADGSRPGAAEGIPAGLSVGAEGQSAGGPVLSEMRFCGGRGREIPSFFGSNGNPDGPETEAGNED